jgi:brefeldin A-resistance guanine nucleotide exchange factor 1
LRTLPAAIMSSVADQLVAGITALIQTHSVAITSSEQWSTVFFFLSSTAHKDTAAKMSFEMLQSFIYSPDGRLGGGKGLTALNFVAFVECVNSFASVAGLKSSSDETVVRCVLACVLAALMCDQRGCR